MPIRRRNVIFLIESGFLLAGKGSDIEAGTDLACKAARRVGVTSLTNI
jgi:hypothetical protein